MKRTNFGKPNVSTRCAKAARRAIRRRESVLDYVDDQDEE